jgi:hypothetical protein
LISPRPAATEELNTIEPPPEYKAKDFAPGEIPALTDYMKKNDMESTLQAGTLATRRNLPKFGL